MGMPILAGGAFSWLVHMAGALFRPRGPEKSAVAAAAAAVAAYMDAVGTARERQAQRRGFIALHHAWQVLSLQQPAGPSRDRTLHRLHGLNRRLHLIAVAALHHAGRGERVPPETAQRARYIAVQAAHPPPRAGAQGPGWQLPARPGFSASLRQNLDPASPPMAAALRAGAAALVAGAIATVLGLERAYWAVAAAVLMLHTGLSWLRTLQRGLERLAGTLLGIGLAALIFRWHPQGFWLLATVMLLQFGIEMLVVRNYALAAVFITATALTVGTGGLAVPDPSSLLVARVVDTLLGCTVALAVFRLTLPRSGPAGLPAALSRTLHAVDAAVLELAAGRPGAAAALRVRGQLQQSTMRLIQAHEAAAGGSPAQRDAAERFWPAIAVVEQLAYRTLAAWTTALYGGEDAGEEDRLPDPDGVLRLHTVLSGLAAAAETGQVPAPLGKLPALLQSEIHAAHEVLSARWREASARQGLG